MNLWLRFAKSRTEGIVMRNATQQRTTWTVRQAVEINAPPEYVWPYVATAEGYRRWSCTPADPYEVVLEPRVGGRYMDHGVVRDLEWTNFGEVIVYEPPRRITFTFQNRRSDGSLSPLQTVTITLTDLGGRTRLSLEHTGLEQLPAQTRDETFRSFDRGWAAGLDDLVGILVRELAARLGRLSVYKRIEVKAPIERAWWYVATQEGNRARHQVESTADIRYGEEILEERVGGRYELRGIYRGEPFRVTGRVLAYEPPRRLVLSWREDGWPADTVVTFFLSERSGRTSWDLTRVAVIHEGFENLPPEVRDGARQSYEIGRERGMETLRRLLMNGDKKSQGE